MSFTLGHESSDKLLMNYRWQYIQHNYTTLIFRNLVHTTSISLMYNTMIDGLGMIWNA